MSTHTHDNLCDWQPCAMCVETSERPSLTLSPGANIPGRQCCSDCDLDTRDSGPTIPTFDTDWQQAPRLTRRLITEADAEYFWLKGQQAGRIAEQVETRRWLSRMVEGYNERVGR